jgi:RimJ/RimL family protein N-acetyltransferase
VFDPVDLSPLFGLRLRTPRLELRLADEEELACLAELAAAGIHPPETMPFAVPWTDRSGEPTFVEEFVEFHLAQRQSWCPDDWHLDLSAWAGDQPVGMQGIGAKELRRDRTVADGSWLSQALQGQGYGTEMRTAVLELAFAGLGAERAESAAIEGNTASARVSTKLGYDEVGEGTVAPRGVELRLLKYTITAERWQTVPHDPVEIVGLQACLPLFGL